MGQCGAGIAQSEAANGCSLTGKAQPQTACHTQVNSDQLDGFTSVRDNEDCDNAILIHTSDNSEDVGPKILTGGGVIYDLMGPEQNDGNGSNALRST